MPLQNLRKNKHVHIVNKHAKNSNSMQLENGKIKKLWQLCKKVNVLNYSYKLTKSRDVYLVKNSCFQCF